MRRLLAAAVVVPLLALPGAAHAASWSGAEPAGDAVSVTHSDDPAPCGTTTETSTSEGDITRLAVRHTRGQVRLALHVTGLTTAKRTFTTFTVRTESRVVDVALSRVHGHTRVELSDAPDLRDLDPDECGAYYYAVGVSTCRGAVGDIDAEGDTVVATLPRACLDRPRFVQVAASISGHRGDARFHDSWIPDGADDGSWLTPVYGPRVKHPARPAR